jgi:hypothetical protein
VHERLPRLQSSPDLELDSSTCLSDLIGELARLSDRSSVPERTQAVWGDINIGPEDTYIASLIAADVTIDEILAMSCLSDDDTLGALARLISLGMVTIPAR